MELLKLTQFLLDCNEAGYARGDSKQWHKETDCSTTIPFTQGKWSAHDNFFGGEPYGGRLVVAYQKKPVWIMVYYGWVAEGVKVDPIYVVLREALSQMPAEAPFRGPAKLTVGEFEYQNDWQGSVEQFAGEESISLQGLLQYQANYRGGLVDVRAGG